MSAKSFLSGLLAGSFLALIAVAIVALTWMRKPVVVPKPTPAQDGDITVSVGESYLSTVVTEMARERDESIQSVAVDVQPDGRLDMVVAARVRVLALETTLQIKLVCALQVADQALLFSVQTLQVVGINIPLDVLPESLRSAITDIEVEANRQAKDLLRDNKLVPLSVSSDATRLTVSLQAK